MSGIGKWLKRGGAAAALLLAAVQPALAAPEVAAASPPPRPAIWVVEDEDTKIYLFGTVHVFPAGLKWRSAAVDRAIAQADELVMETPDASTAEMELSERMLDRMALDAPEPVLERVAPALRPRLRAALEETELPIEYYDELQTWAIAFMLTGFQLARQIGGEEGAAGLSGAEDELGALFKASGRPIGGVETIEEQLGVFASMPAEAQRLFLESTLADPEAVAAEQERGTEKSWVSGDIEAIAAEMQAMPRALYEPLLTRRNRNWADWLVRRMAQPGIVLFAVGVGHLAGPDSVQRMLAARGLQARRVD